MRSMVFSARYVSFPIGLRLFKLCLLKGQHGLYWLADLTSLGVVVLSYKNMIAACSTKIKAQADVSIQILTSQIRNEIASCSETAYPSLPISSTKNLLFLDSEGAVVSFAQNRGWLIKDGRIYFPKQSLKANVDEEGNEKQELSAMAIENTLGYARELETIV